VIADVSHPELTVELGVYASHASDLGRIHWGLTHSAHGIRIIRDPIGLDVDRHPIGQSVGECPIGLVMINEPIGLWLREPPISCCY